MKKLITVLAVSALFTAFSFAQDVDSQLKDAAAAAVATAEEQAKTAVADTREEHAQSLQGIWYDSKYNCNWVFTLNTDATALCELRMADTDELVYKFTKDNVKNFKQALDVTNGATFTWECPSKNRTYRFTKPINATKDLDLDIYNTYYKESHRATIVFKDVLAK